MSKLGMKSKMKDLLADPVSRAILEKHLGDGINDPRMAQGMAFPLKTILKMAPKGTFPKGIAEAIEADFNALSNPSDAKDEPEGLGVEKIDHIHIKVGNMSAVSKAFNAFLDAELVELDFTDDYGMKVGFNPFPNGLEIMEVTDASKEMAKLYNEAPDGVFAISFKVSNMAKAIPQMEAFGNSLIMKYEFGEIKEALFDTKETMGVFVELIEYSTDDITAADSGM